MADLAFADPLGDDNNCLFLGLDSNIIYLSLLKSCGTSRGGEEYASAVRLFFFLKKNRSKKITRVGSFQLRGSLRKKIVQNVFLL